jgi:hypothetical protein
LPYVFIIFSDLATGLYLMPAEVASLLRCLVSDGECMIVWRAGY